MISHIFGMKKNKKKDVSYTKERVILSDVLPYEVPPYFSNRQFYKFLIENKVSFNNSEITFSYQKGEYIIDVIRMLFSITDTALNENIFCTNDNTKIATFTLHKNEKNLIKIPYSFKISHKKNHDRTLSVIHPINQLKLIDFYDQYKYDILFHTMRSNFSARFPSKIASVKYFKDSTHKRLKSKLSEIELIETNNKEYISLKTFFAYAKYNNINQIYESHEYQEAEQKFKFLTKIDIARCFDSIYTHSISWAILGKEQTKQKLNQSKKTFAYMFDYSMQKLNYNETNGIVIGPEFSRIFAEIILQKADWVVEQKLKSRKRPLVHHKDYIILRYVDDFFIFTLNLLDSESIVSLYEEELASYNLYLNNSKTQIFEHPIITNITIAKDQLKRVVNAANIFNISNITTTNKLEYSSAQTIITTYKSILQQTNNNYDALQSYFLGIIFNKIKRMTSGYQKRLYSLVNKLKAEDKDSLIDEEILLIQQYKAKIRYSLNECIKVIMFLYSVQPSVPHSITTTHSLYRIINFIKSQESYMQKIKCIDEDWVNDIESLLCFSFDEKHTMYKLIFDSCLSSLDNHVSLDEYSENGSLYILTLLTELAPNYKVSPLVLEKLFYINENDISVTYFTIVTLINYIKFDTTYNDFRIKLFKIIKERFKLFDHRKAEDTFFLLDILVCPYIRIDEEKELEYKLSILNASGYLRNSTLSRQDKIDFIKEIKVNIPSFFYQWKSNNLGLELNTKRGHQVY